MMVMTTKVDMKKILVVLAAIVGVIVALPYDKILKRSPVKANS